MPLPIIPGFLDDSFTPEEINLLNSIIDKGSDEEDPKTTGSIQERQGLDRISSDFDENDWRMRLQTQLARDMRSVAENTGYPSFVLDSWLRDSYDNILTYLDPFAANQGDFDVFATNLNPNIAQAEGFLGADNVRGIMGNDRLEDQTSVVVNGKLNPHTPDGLFAIYQQSLAYIDTQMPGFSQALAGTGGGGGGGGARGPSAQDIRNQFDIGQLTDAAMNLGRTYLVEDINDAKQIAMQYVDEVVSSMGKKQLDFKTFVINRLRKKGRWGMMYDNKPEGLSEEAYIQPLVATAAAALGGSAGDNQAIGQVVGGAAALGGSGQGLVARLQREDAVRNTSGFITGLEDRLRGISGLLRG